MFERCLLARKVAKDPGLNPEERIRWGAGSMARMEIIGDSELVVNWLNGDYEIRNPEITQQLGHTMLKIHESVLQGHCTFRTSTARPARHVKRAWNTLADTVANAFVTEDQPFTHSCSTFQLVQCERFRLCFDGASKGNLGPSAAGWID